VASIEYNFTDDQAPGSVIDAVDNLSLLSGWTPTGQAIEQAINLFNGQSTDSFAKHLFIVTDGQPTRSTDPCATGLGDIGATIVTIDLAIDATGLECLVDHPLTDIIDGADFSQSNFDAINAKLTSVPVPAAFWLFSSGLMLLASRMTKRK
jgi:hypothetical protein